MELKINNKLFALKGCIGRREYILNMMIVNLVVTLLVIPFSYWSVRSCENPIEILNFAALFASAPLSVMFFYVIACLIGLSLCFGLVFRRIADMKGRQLNIFWYFVVATFILVPYIWMFKMNIWTGFLFVLSIIMSFVLMCFPGKITSQLPHNELKRFNWGAFWGTWIWGLFNKSPITLFMIPLFFTPLSITFMIICGIKGNEWAFKNTKALDSEKFHKKQKNQAIFWNSFAGFVIFIFPFLVLFFLIAYSVKSAMKNPDSLNKVSEVISEFAEELIVSNVTDYELDVEENKFYMDPSIWINLSYEEKYDFFKGVTSFASMKKAQSSDPKYERYYKSRTEEMGITKIYSSYNGEILAEFNLEDVEDVKDLKSAFKLFMKALYFNSRPQLPIIEN